MKKAVSFLLAVSLLAAFTGCGDGGGNGQNGFNNADDILGIKNHSYEADSDDSSNYSAEPGMIPRGWETFYGDGFSISADGSLWEKSTETVVASLNSPDLILMRAGTGSFRTNINVISTKLPKGISGIDAYVRYSVDCANEAGTYTYKDQKKGRANETEGYYMYLEGEMYNISLGCYQFICVSDNKAYVFTFTDTLEEIDKYEDEFHEIMDTLEFYGS